MSAPLTKGQKAYLAKQARAAFALALARGHDVPDCGCGNIPAPERYRHIEVIKAASRHGLCCCSQDDYNRVKAHFLNLLGEPGAALKAHMRAETEPRRLVEWKVVQRCKEYGIALAKAEGICRQMTHGKTLQDATVPQLWNVYFKLRYYEPKREAA